MNIKIFLPFLLITTFAFAQGEANIWYFGDKAGLDFNSGSPVVLTDGQMTAYSGCASISNASGQLLFYSNGMTVWNKNHQIMFNGTGLLGNFAAQSATIVPKPGSSTLYYLFTMDTSAGIDGFRYSVIDMSLAGGLGAVTDKNILIYTPSCEKVAVIKHANGNDYWVVIHGFNNNTFQSYLLSATGLSATSVNTNIGFTTGPAITNGIGQMKISPDGSRLAISHYASAEIIQLFDFNNATGIVSNPIDLDSFPESSYGVEFSPNSKILYTSQYLGEFINQYDLAAANIIASKIVLSLDSRPCRGMQIGPDGKIYLSLVQERYLGVINKPNLVGLACDFVNYAIYLNDRLAKDGLPAFNQSYFYSSFNVENLCLNQTTQFTINSNETITSATWNFGDGSPLQSSVIGTHQYAAAGTYNVTVTATSASGTSTKTRNIVISAMPTATTPANMLVCDTNNDGFFNFNLTTQNSSILNGQDPSQYTIKYYANANDYSNKTVIATPNNYSNQVAYQQQTIIAEVSNNDNSDCKATTSFSVDVFDSPVAPITVSSMTSCDNTSFGTDTDGKVLFDLTQKASPILNGQSAAQFVLSYYTDASLTNLITTPTAYANTATTQAIYVKIANVDNVNCFVSTSFVLQVFDLPIISPTTLKQCDDNIDGFSVFNLTEANSKISTNAVNETFAYFATQAEAESNSNPILNFTSYTNQLVSNDLVYVRVTNANGCFRVVALNLIVSTTQIPLNFTRQFTACDDAVLGTHVDGVAAFDFSSVTSQIQSIFPVGQLLTITYYKNVADALAETNAIANISNYRNVGYPHTQNIYVRVDSQLNNDCLGLGSHISLTVERIPVVSAQIINHCDDDQDGLYGFDTTTVQSNLLNGLTGVTVGYFDQNNVPLPSPLPNPFVTSSQTIKAVVANTTTTACNYETMIKFVVDDLPEAFALPTALTTVCDDEVNPLQQDGLFAFDTSSFQSTILGAQTGMAVQYFDGNNNALASPLPNPLVSGSQNIRVEVSNPLNSACKATMTIPLVVQAVPNISLAGNEIVCNEPSFTKTIDAGIVDGSPTTDYTYVWKKDGQLIASATHYDLTVFEAGVYTVDVFNANGCSRTKTITVIASDKATVTHVEIIDLSNPNTVTVYVTGSGNYVYALDNENGLYQEDNTFTNVSAGIHTVFIKDLNGCGTTPKEIAVLGIPEYFTPNGDGVHDYWNIQGANANFNKNTIIYIFDRFGKLLKEISPSGLGWNGVFNDEAMPATDYWYSIALENGKSVKGHFALKR